MQCPLQKRSELGIVKIVSLFLKLLRMDWEMNSVKFKHNFYDFLKLYIYTHTEALEQ